MITLRMIVPYIAGVVAIAVFSGGCGNSSLVKSQIEYIPKESQIITTQQNGLTFSVLPYSKDMEEEAFGTELREQDILTVEIKVEYNTSKQDSSTFVFRRQDMQLIFDNKHKRYPLDPLKVYERTRVNTSTAAITFGFLGGLAAQNANKNRYSSFTDVAIEQSKLNRKQKFVGGFLFFDLKSTDGGKSEALVIEYENVDSMKSDRLKIRL